MAARKISARKLSVDMHRKLSAISNCSEISDISVRLGMNPDDFKSTIQNILDLDVGGEEWLSEDEDSLLGYGQDEEAIRDYHPSASSLSPQDRTRKKSEIITINARKSSTGSDDSLNSAEDMKKVEIDMDSLKNVLNIYSKHQRKISVSKLIGQPTPRQLLDAGTNKQI